jgi:hypothetical protein
MVGALFFSCDAVMSTGLIFDFKKLYELTVRS